MVPLGTRRAALTGLSLYTACRPSAVAAQRAAWALVAVLGPRVLAGRRTGWDPPMSLDIWHELCTVWRSTLGHFDVAAIYQRRQASRSGVGALLMCRGNPVAFVKAHPKGSRIDVERHALACMADRPGSCFSTPVVLGHGRHLDWDWLAVSPLPSGPHRPMRHAPLGRIIREVQAGLRPMLDPAGVPPLWQPIHGDLTPWNLRQIRRGDLWLIDWEDCTWGPPDADEAYYQATVATVTKTTPEACSEDAVQFWHARVRDRSSRDADKAFNVALTEVLTSMAPGSKRSRPARRRGIRI